MPDSSNIRPCLHHNFIPTSRKQILEVRLEWYTVKKHHELHARYVKNGLNKRLKLLCALGFDVDVIKLFTIAIYENS